MSTIQIRHALILLSLSLLLSAPLSADQIPDPDVSQKEAIGHMHHQLHDDQASFKAAEAKAL
ncbi:MAG: hypothetical protein V7754_23430, partial [Halioglobus sp.]